MITVVGSVSVPAFSLWHMSVIQTCEQARPEVINAKIRTFLSAREGRLLTRDESLEYQRLTVQWLAAKRVCGPGGPRRAEEQLPG